MKTTKVSSILNAAILVATIGLTMCANALDKETVLYAFRMQSGGDQPVGKLTRDSSGNMYGVTQQGGANGLGTIFELSPASGGGWTYTVLYNFSNSLNEFAPGGSLAMDAAGNLYGTTVGLSEGEIYELSPNGSGGWNQTVLYVDGANDGFFPSPVVLDASGNLYGTNELRSSTGGGFVFEVSPSSGGAWTFRHIHDFSGGDGDFPAGGVTLDASGNLYGSASIGGSSTNCTLGCGVIYKLTQSGGVWSETVLYSFTGSNGSSPQGLPLLAPNGAIFGTTASGGTFGFGTVFELRLNAGVWQPHTLHNFKGYPVDGADANSGVLLYGGNLYGTTSSGGPSPECGVGNDIGCGTAFELTNASGNWKEILLHGFHDLQDGGFPGGLIVDSSGNLFGLGEVAFEFLQAIK